MSPEGLSYFLTLRLNSQVILFRLKASVKVDCIWLLPTLLFH